MCWSLALASKYFSFSSNALMDAEGLAVNASSRPSGQHLSHPVELDSRPFGGDVPGIKAVGRHRDQGRGRRAKDPFAHFILPRLAGLIGVFGSWVHTTFELHRTPEEVAESAIWLFVSSVKRDISLFDRFGKLSSRGVLLHGLVSSLVTVMGMSWILQ